MLTVFAIGRFEDLLEKVANFKTEECIYDNFKNVERERKINLRVGKVGQVLGKDIDAGLISGILTNLKVDNRI